jgi:propionyl-CoA carboxylase alpha chain
MDIPIYYDPMIAKLIAYGKDRTEAIERMKRAIDEYQITGPETTLAFCRFVMGHEAFVSGQFDTNFIARYFRPETLGGAGTDTGAALAAALAVTLLAEARPAEAVQGPAAKSRWKENRR